MVFVSPSPGNLLPQRPCQSSALGSPPLPYPSSVPRLPGHGKDTIGVTEDTSSCLGAVRGPCSWLNSFLHLLLPSLHATPELTHLCFPSFSLFLLHQGPSFPGLRAQFPHFHPQLLIFSVPFLLLHSWNLNCMRARIFIVLLYPVSRTVCVQYIHVQWCSIYTCVQYMPRQWTYHFSFPPVLGK